MMAEGVPWPELLRMVHDLRAEFRAGHAEVVAEQRELRRMVLTRRWAKPASLLMTSAAALVGALAGVAAVFVGTGR